MISSGQLHFAWLAIIRIGLFHNLTLTDWPKEGVRL
jgi:hypothetical protein